MQFIFRLSSLTCLVEVSAMSFFPSDFETDEKCIFSVAEECTADPV